MLSNSEIKKRLTGRFNDYEDIEGSGYTTYNEYLTANKGIPVKKRPFSYREWLAEGKPNPKEKIKNRDIEADIINLNVNTNRFNVGELKFKELEKEDDTYDDPLIIPPPTFPPAEPLEEKEIKTIVTKEEMEEMNKFINETRKEIIKRGAVPEIGEELIRERRKSLKPVSERILKPKQKEKETLHEQIIRGIKESRLRQQLTKDIELQKLTGTGLNNVEYSNNSYSDKIRKMYMKRNIYRYPEEVYGGSLCQYDNLGAGYYDRFMNYLTGSNDMRDGERHALLYTKDGFKSGSYIGPNTHLIDRLKENINPINKTDKTSQAHDIRYNLATSPEEIRNADLKMVNKLNELSKNKEDYKYNIAIGKYPIQAKMILEDLGIVGRDTFTDTTSPPKKENMRLLKKKLRELEAQGYGIY
jgi:hypothetical protein